MHSPSATSPSPHIFAARQPAAVEQEQQDCATARTLTACPDAALPLLPPATGASLKTVLGMEPVARCLAQCLPALDLLNLRHSVAPGSRAHAALCHQVAIKDKAAVEVMLAKAVHCLSCPRREEDQDLHQDLQDALQDSAFFEQKIEPGYGQYGHPLPDLVQDSPQAFAFKCQTIDKALRCLYTMPPPCVDALLRLAMANGDVAVAFRILQMLQELRQQGCLGQSLLENALGMTLLSGQFFHQQLSPLWRRLVLAAAVFDLHPPHFTPLSEAIRLGRDAEAVELLLEAGARPDHGDSQDPVPLIGCVDRSIEQAVEKMDALLRHGANPNQIPPEKDRWVFSALHCAAHEDMPGAALRLLAHPDTNPDLLCPRWCGSPLTSAAVEFLVHRSCSGNLVHLLAARGCRMLVRTSFPGYVRDCGDNINGLMSISVGPGPLSSQVSEERKAQLRALLAQGRQDAAEKKEEETGDTGVWDLCHIL